MYEINDDEKLKDILRCNFATQLFSHEYFKTRQTCIQILNLRLVYKCYYSVDCKNFFVKMVPFMLYTCTHLIYICILHKKTKGRSIIKCYSKIKLMQNKFKKLLLDSMDF